MIKCVVGEWLVIGSDTVELDGGIGGIIVGGGCVWDLIVGRRNTGGVGSVLEIVVFLGLWNMG